MHKKNIKTYFAFFLACISHNSAAAFLPIFFIKNKKFIRIAPKTTYGAPARGATVILVTNKRKHAKTIDAGSGYLCQMEPIAHYGFRKNEIVNNVIIKWTDGSINEYKVNDLNKTYVFRKGL